MKDGISHHLFPLWWRFFLNAACWLDIAKECNYIYVNLTAPDGLLHTTIWKGSIGNHLEKGRRFKNTLAGDWINHLSATVYRSLILTWFSTNQQITWPVEPLGKLNSYKSQSGEEQKHLFHQRKKALSVILALFRSDRTDAMATSTLTTSVADIVVFWASHT